MKKVKNELKLGLIVLVMFVGGLHILDFLLGAAQSFFTGKEYLLILLLPITMMVIGIKMIKE